ncbi:glycosyltransferase [Paenibacillus donghaensis]|uniref:Glycosyl transferase family 1 domain-containing protein n=1 Tax=Paenibacillus donghaensis TaxID=414771 RepID=A0A2Z2KKF5_9BACL|nr:glycosyltransferase [Paenibacillus donghaensis]ASA23773.1 hypothetical protein B9T62_25120 [Paenibacillus donghaensis]
MREHMLFISARNQNNQDIEGDIRTGNLLAVLLEKFAIDLLVYGDCTSAPAVEGVAGLKVHTVKRHVTPRRTMLRSLYTLRNYSPFSNADRDMKAMLEELCGATEYSHVFIAHSLLGNCIDRVRQMLPEAVIVTDAQRSESALSAGQAAVKRGISKPYHKLNAALVRRDEKRLMNKTGLLLATSEWDALSFKALSFEDAAKVHVVPVSIDMKEYPPVPDAHKENRIVLHWNLNTQQGKNAALLFIKKLYPLIKEEVPDVQCSIVGENLHADILSLVDKDASLTIADRCSTEAVLRSKVLISPLLEGCASRLHILEAWALKTAVVSTARGAEGLNCEHNRNILLAHSSAEMAAHVVRLLKEPELGALLADRAYQTLLKHYEASEVKAKLLSLV